MTSLQGPKNLIFMIFNIVIQILLHLDMEHELKVLWVFHFVPETGPPEMTKVIGYYLVYT